jgi:hypothetical protein
MVREPRHRAAVCVLRVEAHGERLVITLTTSHDLDRRLYAARREWTRRMADVGDALVGTDEFLRGFATGLPPRAAPVQRHGEVTPR